MPLQGEALYLMKPERITNGDPRDQQRRLEKLAFCALAFAYTDLAHEAVKASLSINVLDSSEIQKFLKLFHQEISKVPNLPPLWHDFVEAEAKTGARKSGKGPFAFRLVNRILEDPKLFVTDLRRFLSNHIIKTLVFLKLEKLGFKRFESFLSRYGFERAARVVYFRRIR